ncbi:hypothetical protein [Litoribaculum gwangyangense]|uniref:Uncharacterized protein n=1 Tax=Litoribaculum gwangyangense TaxID=1130722 RepID=A0ABP9CNS9_9FLAO
MDNFQKIIRQLRKSSLDDIAKKCGIETGKLPKNKIAEKIDKFIEKNHVKKSFYSTSIFQIGYPILLLFIGFIIGSIADISNSNLKNTIDKNDSISLKKIQALSQPLPIELKMKFLKINIEKKGFIDFIPEINELYKTAQVVNSFSDDINNPGASEFTFQFMSKWYSEKYYSKEFRDFFDNLSIYIGITVGDNLLDEQTEKQKPYLYWKYNTKLDLTNPESQHTVNYRIDYNNNNSESLILSIPQEDSEFLIKSDINFDNSISSALELCGKKVSIYITLIGNRKTLLTSPVLTFENFTIEDNLHRQYDIEFVKVSDYYGKESISKLQENALKTYGRTLNIDVKNHQIYLEGIFTCKSF